MNPAPGNVLEMNLVGANKGDVWTGFEWVTLERYEELRAGPMPNLPPVQGTATFESYVQFPGDANEPPAPPPPVRQATPQDYEQWRVEAAVSEILEAVDPTPDREGLADTPTRVAKAWAFWTSGYNKDPADLFKVFEDGAEGADEMVVVRDIPVYSKCEHHLADIFGYATVAYIPNGKIVGLSKLNRLVDMYARRLQVQERMTNQVATAIMTHLAPHGCGVVIKARHMCMESRGVQHCSHTITSALRGVFKDDPTVRAEFLALGREVRNA